MDRGVGSDRSPRHCMIVHAHYPVGETRVQRQADILVARGYEVDVLCLRDRGERRYERIDGVRIRRLPVRRHRSWGLAGQALEYLLFFAAVLVTFSRLHRRQPYDTVQVHNLPDVLVFAAVAARRTGTPIILDLHDLMPEFLASRIRRPMHHPLVRIMAWQERRSCAFADHVITVTDGWRDALVARGVHRGKISVVMNLADPRIFGRAVPSPRSPNGRLELIYHGTVTERYGLDVLLRALAAVRRAGVDAHLLLHGRGDALEDLRSLADTLELDDHVTFSTALVATEALPGLIAGADIGIVPYRSDVFTDGILPTKLLEYVATGVPVIASRTPAITRYFDTSMVHHVEPGSDNDLAAAIRDLASSPEDRAALAANAKAFEDQHSWQTAAAAYAQLIKAMRPVAPALPSGTTVERR
jgi:glycosyltransferase involved in cell wall biosynthesis